MWQKEQAVNLCAQLPESMKDKLLILQYMRELIDWTYETECRVLPFAATGTSSSA